MLFAKASKEVQLEKKPTEIEKLAPGAKVALERTNLRQWCIAYFRSRVKCDTVDNSTEAFNLVLIRVRCLPIISMFEAIREYVMGRRVHRNDFIRK